MKCPKCSHADTRVLDSRVVDNDRAIRRRRACEDCDYRFTTYEKAELATFVVVKKDGNREPYHREKVMEGIWRACTKRPVTVDQVSDALTLLEEQWSTEREVASQKIGEDVMAMLRGLDEIAYVRFASVYKRFRDVEQFRRELERLV